MSDYAVINPATGETVQTYPTIGDADLQDAIAKVADAHATDTSTVKERADLLRRVGELHAERRTDLAQIITREMGKPKEAAEGEVDFCVAIYDFYADNAEGLLADEPIELLEGEGRALVRRSALGPLLGIMPWNYPYYQVARFAAPNLLVGNTILLKHAPQCPESAAAIEQIFRDAGFPQGAYVNVYATNDQIEWVIADPRIRAVSLTGSERAGSAVAAIAGKHLKKVVLELGGSDPFIVLGSKDLDATVQQAVEARLDNSGQACNAAKRFIVLDTVYDEFMAKFVPAVTDVKPADPTQDGVLVGPLSSDGATERLAGQLADALDGGAELVAGGTHDGNFFDTTILTGLTADNPAYGEEFFGPVASVFRVGSEQEAIALANDTAFGLGSYVFTDDEAQALRVADALDTGMVFINVVGAEGAELPFGGVKRSGFGRELGRFGTEEFVNKKMIRIGG